MTALVEVHDEDETQRAVDAGATRHRGQRPQPQDPRDPPRDVLPAAPAHPRQAASPSPSPASPTPRDAASYAAQGADAVLVGEALVRTGDPRAGAASMVAAGAPRPATREDLVPDPTTATPGRRTDLVPEELARPGRFGAVRRPLRPRGADPGTRAARRGPPEGRGRPRVPRRARPAAPHLHRPAEHHHRGAAVRRALRRGARHPQARGPQPHRLAQDQQRPRPGPADQADGQDPGHRRDRRRPARRRHRDRGRPDGARLHGLHGPGRHRAPGAQRRPDADPRRRGRAGRARQRHPQGRHQRGAARLGHQRRHHALPHRHRHRPAPVPRDGPRLPPDHRRGGPRAGARAHRPAPGRRRSRASAAAPTPWASSTASSRTPACASSASRPGARASSPAGTRPGSRGVRVARGAARRDELPHAGRRRPDRRVALGLRRAGLPERRAGARVPARQRPRRVPATPPTTRPWRRSRLLCRTEGIIPAIESAHALVGRHGGRAASSAPTPSLLVNLSGRGDKDMDTAATWFGLLDGVARDAPRSARASRRCCAAAASEGRAALVGYLPVGFPTVEGSLEAMRVLVEAGCDVVEVGVPYSDPLMDGPVIQHAAATALAGGARVDDVFRATRGGPRGRRHPARHDLLEPRAAPGCRAVRRRPRRRAVAPG